MKRFDLLYADGDLLACRGVVRLSNGTLISNKGSCLEFSNVSTNHGGW